VMSQELALTLIASKIEGLEVHAEMLETLKSGHTALQQSLEDFVGICKSRKDLDICCFYEQKTTYVGKIIQKPEHFPKV